MPPVRTNNTKSRITGSGERGRSTSTLQTRALHLDGIRLFTQDMETQARHLAARHRQEWQDLSRALNTAQYALIQKARELDRKMCPTGAEPTLHLVRAPYQALPGEAVMDWMARVFPQMGEDWLRQDEGVYDDDDDDDKPFVHDAAKVLAYLQPPFWKKIPWGPTVLDSRGRQWLQRVLDRCLCFANALVDGDDDDGEFKDLPWELVDEYEARAKATKAEVNKLRRSS